MNETVEIVRKNLDRILSLEPVYVLSTKGDRSHIKETYLRRYIGYVLNKDHPFFVLVVHYFLIGNRIRKFCQGDKYTVLNGRISDYNNSFCRATTVRNSNKSIISEAKDWLILSSDNVSGAVVYDVVNTCFTRIGYVTENTKTIYDR